MSVISEGEHLAKLDPFSFSELKQLNIPTNENLRKVLEPNLKNIKINGSSLLSTIYEMIERKCYRDYISNLEVWIRAAEDIAKDLIREPDDKKIGITGSDFLIGELYELPSFELTERVGGEGDIYKDPRKLIEYNLPLGKVIRFKGKDAIGDKIVEAVILKYDTSPKLCVLGPGDETFKQLIKRKKEAGKKIDVAEERRNENLVIAYLENNKAIKEIGYNLIRVTRTTEGYIKKSKDEVGKADIGIDIGETFSTAKANGLILYEEIIQTYPILLRCYRP